MLKFSRFLNLARSILSESGKTNSENGVYAACIPDSGSIKRIVQLQEELGLENPVASDKLHATVMYSRKHVDEDQVREVLKYHLPTSAFGDELALFGQRTGDKCLVLKLSSVGLLGIHTDMRKLGATHDFPMFEAHTTLAYGLSDDFKVPGYAGCIPIHFDDFEVKPLED